VAIECRKVAAQLAQVKEAIDTAKKMICWNEAIEIERVEQLVLRACLPTHHLDTPRHSLMTYDIRVMQEFGAVFQRNRR
jgi:hypothetical protein